MVIFPQTDNESHGIEDLRMVRFVDDDATVTYYGTCTAFDGYRVLPQLIETSDFERVGVHTINGACAEQRHGAFPAADRRALCHVFADRRREPLHHGLRHRSLLGDRRVARRHLTIPGSSCKSATAARPWKRPKAGCC